MKKGKQPADLADLNRHQDNLIHHTCGLLALLTSSLEHKEGNGLHDFRGEDAQNVALLCQHLSHELTDVQRSIGEMHEAARLKAGGKPI